MRTSSLLVAAAACTLLTVSTAQAQQVVVNDFNEASDTSGATTDRYAPATFQSDVTYGGRGGTLEAGVVAADGADFRPGGFGDAFYNTQGKAFSLGAGVTETSIELFGDTAYSGSAFDGRRIAGFWGVAYDGAPVTAYPIIELEKLNGTLNLRGYNTTLGTWNNYGLSDFTLGEWNTLSIKLDTGLNTFQYSVNGILLGNSGSANGSEEIKSAIIQAHNTKTGVTYNNHWDNLTTGAVPEPGTWALMILGFGTAGAMLRRRNTAVSAAA